MKRKISERTSVLKNISRMGIVSLNKPSSYSHLYGERSRFIRRARWRVADGLQLNR